MVCLGRTGRRWTKLGGGNRETRRGRSGGARRYGHLSTARARRDAVFVSYRRLQRVAWVLCGPSSGTDGVQARRVAIRVPVEGATGTGQPSLNRCWQRRGGVEVAPRHEATSRNGGARIVAPRAKISTTRITEPQQRHTKPRAGVVGGAASGSTAMAGCSVGGGAASS